MSTILAGKRDPRIDPRKGDSIRQVSAERVMERTVAVRLGDSLGYVRRPDGPVVACTLKQWRSWATNARILKASE